MTPPVAKATDLSAGVKITIGAPLDPALLARVVELRVETTAGLPDVCVLRLAEDEVVGTPTAGLKVIDDQKMKLGALMKVELAAAIGGTLEPVFEGEVTTIEADLRPSVNGGGPLQELIVTAHDRSHRLHRKTTLRTFRQVTATDVARKVAGEHGLRIGRLALGGGDVPSEVVHQVGETDWAFLSRLVREYGGELDVDLGALHIVDPGARATPVAQLVFGEALQRLRARTSTLGQVAEVVVVGWDPERKQQIRKTAKPKSSSPAQEGSVASAVAGTSATVTTAHVASDGAAQAQAKALAQRVGHDRVQAEAVTIGNPKLRAGRTVALSGVGTRFGGDHRIVSAVHVYGPSGYETRLTLGAGGRPLAEARGQGPAGAREFSAQLVIGVVTNNTDPDDLGRIKVRYASLGQDVESGWARVARGAAGAARGAVTLPHVGDEVVLGFEHGDIHRPFVLGALFNGVDKPGADLVKAANSLAARFPRDLDVATKTKTILAADKGVAVTSAQGPVELTGGAITIKAGQPMPAKLTLETTGQLVAKGQLGAEITAVGPIKISGTAPVTIESTAAVQIKGAAIQIQGTGVVQISGAQVLLG